MAPTVIQGDAVGPPVTVVLFGWLGSSERQLQKYAEVYTPKTSGVIVLATAAPQDVMLGRKARLFEVGLEALSCAAVALRAAEGRGQLYIQCFSNGGAMVWEVMQHAMHQENSAIMSDAHKEVLRLTKASLGGLIFDSCPCYLWVSVGLRAIGLAMSNSVARILLQMVFAIVVPVDSLLRVLLGRPLRPIEFWKHWEAPQGDARRSLASDAKIESIERERKTVVSTKQLYIYTPKDRLCDSVKLEQLIATRRSLGVDVTAVRFEDSDHVVHLRKHPIDYSKALLTFCHLA